MHNSNKLMSMITKINYYELVINNDIRYKSSTFHMHIFIWLKSKNKTFMKYENEEIIGIC